MPAVVRLEDLDAYVVKETLRRIRNGQVQLKKRGLITEPEVEIAFQCVVLVPGGLNAISRQTSSTNTQTQAAAAKTTRQESSGETNGTEGQQSADTQQQSYGRTTALDITYEGG